MYNRKKTIKVRDAIHLKGHQRYTDSRKKSNDGEEEEPKRMRHNNSYVGGGEASTTTRNTSGAVTELNIQKTKNEIWTAEDTVYSCVWP